MYKFIFYISNLLVNTSNRTLSPSMIYKKMAAICKLPWTYRKLLVPFCPLRVAYRMGQKVRPRKKAKWTSPYPGQEYYRNSIETQRGAKITSKDKDTCEVGT